MVQDYDKFRQMLLTRQEELQCRVANITKDVTKQASADWSEQAQERENDEGLDALGNEAVAELRLIQRALIRMDEEEYGICIGCGTDIPEARLEIMPYAELCVRCAEKQG